MLPGSLKVSHLTLDTALKSCSIPFKSLISFVGLHKLTSGKSKLLTCAVKDTVCLTLRLSTVFLARKGASFLNDLDSSISSHSGFTAKLHYSIIQILQLFFLLAVLLIARINHAQPPAMFAQFLPLLSNFGLLKAINQYFTLLYDR